MVSSLICVSLGVAWAEIWPKIWITFILNQNGPLVANPDVGKCSSTTLIPRISARVLKDPASNSHADTTALRHPGNLDSLQRKDKMCPLFCKFFWMIPPTLQLCLSESMHYWWEPLSAVQGEQRRLECKSMLRMLRENRDSSALFWVCLSLCFSFSSQHISMFTLQERWCELKEEG